MGVRGPWAAPPSIHCQIYRSAAAAKRDDALEVSDGNEFQQKPLAIQLPPAASIWRHIKCAPANGAANWRWLFLVHAKRCAAKRKPMKIVGIVPAS